MEKEAQELLNWLDGATKYQLPSYEELPHVPLYMEQVVGYINDVLAPLTPDKKRQLTSFMVNNYVKAKMIQEPDKKKYKENQLGYLIAITALKNTMSMSEISLLMEMDKSLSTDKKTLYGFYRVMSQDILSDRSAQMKDKIASLLETYKKEAAAGDEKANDNLRNSIGLFALRMSIESVTYKLVADTMLDSLAKSLHGEATYEFENTPGHHESKRELKIAKAQAERLAAAKEAQVKKNAEEKKKAEEAAKKEAETEKKRLEKEKTEAKELAKKKAESEKERLEKEKVEAAKKAETEKKSPAAKSGKKESK